MRHMTVTGLFLILALAFSCSEAAANLLANPSFEDPITVDGPPFVGIWEGFSSGAGSHAINSGALPRSGAMHVELSVQGDNSFAGVFQDVPNLVPGTTATLSGWHRLGNIIEFDAGVEARIEWRNSVSNMEVSRTPNITPVPTGVYAPFSLSTTVPAGADTARVVYAIQTFGPGPFNTGIVALDDVSFIIPEPSSFMLLALGMGGAVAMWRRRFGA